MEDVKRTRRPILKEETDGLSDRLSNLIGKRSVNMYAKEVGVSEGTVRNLLKGTSPRLDNLVAIANESAVTIEWLITGRGSKTYQELDSEHSTVSCKSPSTMGHSTIKEPSADYSNKQGQITVDVVENIAVQMIEHGLIKKEWQVAIDYFVEIFNRTSKAKRSKHSIVRAILEYQIRFYETQLNNFVIQGEVNDKPNAFQDYKDHLVDLITEARIKLKELNKKAETGLLDF